MASRPLVSPFAKVLPAASPTGQQGVPAAAPVKVTTAISDLPNTYGAMARARLKGAWISPKKGTVAIYAMMPSGAPSSPTLQALRNRGFGASKGIGKASAPGRSKLSAFVSQPEGDVPLVAPQPSTAEQSGTLLGNDAVQLNPFDSNPFDTNPFE